LHGAETWKHTWDVFKYDAGEEWRRSVGPIVGLPSTTRYRRKIEGRIEVTGRRGRKSKELLDDLKEKRGYCKLKEEALDRTLWRTCCGGGYRSVLRQTE